MSTPNRPEAVPTWATDTSYPLDAGPDQGSDTKNEPASGYKAQGARRGSPVQARYLNWLYNILCRWITWFDSGSTVAQVDIASTVDAVEGSKIFSSKVGWYTYEASSALTADGVWVIDATGMGAGQWVHQDIALVNLGKMAAVGPVPGGIYTASAGRVKASVVPNGFYVAADITPHTDSTASTVPTTTTAGAVIDVGGAAGVLTIGTLAIGDVVQCNLDMVANNASFPFTVGAYISFDNGATSIAMSPQPGGGDPSYAAGASNHNVSVSFTKEVTAAGVCLVVFKYGAPGGGTTNASCGYGRVTVFRP